MRETIGENYIRKESVKSSRTEIDWRMIMKKCETCGTYIITIEDMEELRKSG